MRIVLDTNVLVSALLSPFGPPGDILRLITAGTIRATPQASDPDHRETCRTAERRKYRSEPATDTADEE